MPAERHAHERHNLIRFDVCTGSGTVSAFLSRASCRAWAPAAHVPASLADFVRRHRSALDGIVLAKLLAGGRSPVVVSARDLVDGAGCAGPTGLHPD